MKQNQPISELLDGIASFYAEKLCTAWTSLEEKRWDNLLAFLSSVESVIGKIEQAENGAGDAASLDASALSEQSRSDVATLKGQLERETRQRKVNE